MLGLGIYVLIARSSSLDATGLGALLFGIAFIVGGVLTCLFASIGWAGTSRRSSGALCCVRPRRGNGWDRFTSRHT